VDYDEYQELIRALLARVDAAHEAAEAERAKRGSEEFDESQFWQALGRVEGLHAAIVEIRDRFGQ